MKILTQQSVQDVLNSLTESTFSKLEKRYWKNTDVEDRNEYSFSEFFTDLVYQVAYRDRNGRDGNWDEFAQSWKIPSGIFPLILTHMKACGYTKELNRW